jgi:hypothetical protein
MKVVNIRGSHWNLSHDIISKEGKDDIVRHFLRTTVNYKNEKGEDAQSFSKIPLDSAFFPKNEKDSDKGTFNSFDALKSITDVLKDGQFDMISIQRDADISIGKKQHVEWKIIPAAFVDIDNADKRVLVLGGYKGDSVWFDRRGSQNSEGRSVIVAYSQAYDKPSSENERNDGKRIIKEVQFAALLEEGDCVAYHITKDGRRSVIVLCNKNGKIIPMTRSPYAWTQELIKRGLVKMNFDKKVTPRKNSIVEKEPEAPAPTEEETSEAPSEEGSEE